MRLCLCLKTALCLALALCLVCGQALAAENAQAAESQPPLEIQPPLDCDLREYIEKTCQEYGVEPALIYAVIETESGFDPAAVNPAGDCCGLMQIHRGNRGWLSKRFGRELDLSDAYDNVLCGIAILADYVGEYGLHRGLMAYNCGEAGARRLWKKGYETSGYSRRVAGRMEKYEEEEPPRRKIPPPPLLERFLTERGMARL